MDPRVIEFHCIMPIGNVPSVMDHGILSHERAGTERPSFELSDALKEQLRLH